MKVLLINSNQYKLPVPAMPFGVCCIASAVEKAGHDVKVLDLCFSNKCSSDIRKGIAEFQPDIVGISIRNIDTGATYNTLFLLDEVKEKIVNPVKKSFSGPVVIGGPAIGISGAEILEYLDLDYAIKGDGEIAFTDYLTRFEKKLPLNGLSGLIWRRDGHLVEDNPPARINTLNSLPFANHAKYLDLRKYRKFNSPLQIQTKRGCALKCAYCTYNMIEGPNVRFRDPKRIADEIETMVKETGINHIEFTDSTFNIPLNHAKAVLRAIIDKNLDLELQTMGLNPGAIDEELAQLMKKANFKEAHVGVDSGCNSVLEALNKNFKKDDVIRAGKYLREAGIPVMWYILTGAPGETQETLRETYETLQMAASKWDLVIVGNGIRLYKDSPISKQVLKKNPNCTHDNFLHPAAYYPEKISLSTLRILNKQAALQHPNFLFFDEVQRMPMIFLKIQTTLMRLLAPHKPWWKSYIFMNSVKKALGIQALQSLLFSFKNRQLFSRLESRITSNA